MDQQQFTETMDSLLDQREFVHKLKTFQTSLAVFDKYQKVPESDSTPGPDKVTFGKVVKTSAAFGVCTAVAIGASKILDSWATPVALTTIAATLPFDDYLQYKMTNSMIRDFKSLYLSDKYGQDIEQLNQAFDNWESVYLSNRKRYFISGTGILASGLVIMAGEYLTKPKLSIGASVGMLVSMGYLFWASIKEKTHTEETLYSALEKTINDLLGKYKLENLYPDEPIVDSVTPPVVVADSDPQLVETLEPITAPSELPQPTTADTNTPSFVSDKSEAPVDV